MVKDVPVSQPRRINIRQLIKQNKLSRQGLVDILNDVSDSLIDHHPSNQLMVRLSQESLILSICDLTSTTPVT